MYGNELLNINQWENVNITDCNPTNISEDFFYPNGDAILKQYGFKSVSTKLSTKYNSLFRNKLKT